MIHSGRGGGGGAPAPIAATATGRGKGSGCRRQGGCSRTQGCCGADKVGGVSNGEQHRGQAQQARSRNACGRRGAKRGDLGDSLRKTQSAVTASLRRAHPAAARVSLWLPPPHPLLPHRQATEPRTGEGRIFGSRPWSPRGPTCGCRCEGWPPGLSTAPFWMASGCPPSPRPTGPPFGSHKR